MEKCACKGAFLDRFIQPSILMFLNAGDLHGFSILKKLKESNFIDYSGIDPTGLYRMLKKMEKSGLLVSGWDIKDIARTKRIYSITDKGKDCLSNWGETLLFYKKSIDRLIKAVNKNLGSVV